jgi:hypothetical protein
MNPPSFLRADFDQLLAQQERLIGLTNELEYRLHCVAEVPPVEEIQACQQAAGMLISALREFLFRQDQKVLPVLEAMSRPETTPSG